MSVLVVLLFVLFLLSCALPHEPCQEYLAAPSGREVCSDLQYWQDLIDDLIGIINANTKLAPKYIKIVFQSCGSHNRADRSGGCNGAAIRHAPEREFHQNKGLNMALDSIETLIQDYQNISCADIISLAGVVAVSYLGGPDIPFRPGRTCFTEAEARRDYTNTEEALPKSLINSAEYLSAPYFPLTYTANLASMWRMGFSIQEQVALIGAHAVGFAHRNISGFEGRWTLHPNRFSNRYFINLQYAFGEDDNQYNYSLKKIKDGAGNKSNLQYVSEKYQDLGLMFLPSDAVLHSWASYKSFLTQYAQDQDLFFADFEKAFQKLSELGVEDLITETIFVKGQVAKLL